jgi:hypothetical protein
MSQQVAAALAALRDLGTPDEIRVLAQRGHVPAPLPRANTHIHLPPNFSAFDSVEQAVALAAGQEIGVLGVSNYYDYDVYGRFVDRARAEGIFPLFGLEIIAMQEDLRAAGVKVNDPGNPGKTYLCGKGITRFDQMSAAAARLIDVIRRSDSERMSAMTDRMRTIFRDRGLETNVDEQAVIDLVVHRHGSPRETVYLQERHISQAFQEELFARVRPEERLERLNVILEAKTHATSPDDHLTIQNDLRSHLMKAGKPAFVEEAYLSFADAQRLVVELGGMPSYPVLADGASPVCEFEADVDDLIAQLRARNIHAVEWIPTRNSVEVVCQCVTKMREAGLVVTAGTEHNTLDLVPLDPFCKDGPVPDSVREIFWEGACVVAAHQFLALHGECGFVDAAGNPHAAYHSADERIKAFARIGAATVRRYHATCAVG